MINILGPQQQQQQLSCSVMHDAAKHAVLRAALCIACLLTCKEKVWLHTLMTPLPTWCVHKCTVFVFIFISEPVYFRGVYGCCGARYILCTMTENVTASLRRKFPPDTICCAFSVM
jgi:hypothetical protein